MQHPEWLSAAIAEGKRFHFQKKNPWLHNALNLGLLASLLGASTGVFWLGSVTPALPYLLLAPFALGLVFFALFILVVHEAAHGMFVISKSRKRALFYNRLFGWFVSLIIAVDYTRHWEVGHHIHHLRPIEPDDPQATNRLTGRLLLRKCVAYLLIPGYIVYDRLGGSVAKKKTPSTKWPKIGMLLFWIVVITPPTRAWGWTVPVVTLLAVQVLGALNQIKGALEHGGEIAFEDSPYLRSRTSFFPGRRLLMPLNITLHFEHHLNYCVPWYDLVRYHRAIRELVPAELHPELFNRDVWAQLAGEKGRIPEPLRPLIERAPSAVAEA